MMEYLANLKLDYNFFKFVVNCFYISPKGGIMKVSIINNESESVIATYNIDLGVLDHTPSNEEYFAQAWLRAIEEDVVDENDYSEYSFRI